MKCGKRERPIDEFDGPRDYSPKLIVEVSNDKKNWTKLGMILPRGKRLPDKRVATCLPPFAKNTEHPEIATIEVIACGCK